MITSSVIVAIQCKCVDGLSPAVDGDCERGQTMRASLRPVDCRRFVALSNITASNIDRLFELKLKQAGTLARPYDAVVRAMGWKHNSSLYGEGAQPLLQSQKKYARMTVRLHLTIFDHVFASLISSDSNGPMDCGSHLQHEYESVNVPGMCTSSFALLLSICRP